MGRDKALIAVNGEPLWRRQLRILRELEPHELFMAAPPRAEWSGEGCILISDALPNAGPLGGLTSALRACSSPLLLTLAIDLPAMSADYLRELLTLCGDNEGIVPRLGDRYEPVAAVYPRAARPFAESSLADRQFSLQQFAAGCVTQRLVRPSEVGADEQAFFLNLNRPEDLLAVRDNELA